MSLTISINSSNVDGCPVTLNTGRPVIPLRLPSQRATGPSVFKVKYRLEGSSWLQDTSCQMRSARQESGALGWNLHPADESACLRFGEPTVKDFRRQP